MNSGQPVLLWQSVRGMAIIANTDLQLPEGKTMSTLLLGWLLLLPQQAGAEGTRVWLTVIPGGANKKREAGR